MDTKIDAKIIAILLIFERNLVADRRVKLGMFLYLTQSDSYTRYS